MICLWPACNNTTNFRNGKWSKYCLACKNKGGVNEFRRKIKQMAIEYKGNKCLRCGYDTCSYGLVFHHLDPSKKSFGIAKNGHIRSWDETKKELDKCILVCQNCHAEIHSGLHTDWIGSLGWDRTTDTSINSRIL